MNTKKLIEIAVIVSLIIIGTQNAMAIEEASYVVIKKDNAFEVREYTPHILAETLVGGELKQAGGKAFQRLFGYISGNNVSRTKVAMTAPISQKAAGEKIQMTAPVAQQRIQDQ